MICVNYAIISKQKKSPGLCVGRGILIEPV